MPADPVTELYGLPLDEFVAGRDTLARELRSEGDKERAADVAKLKKPSVAAWAVNQLARGNRKQLDLLLDAGHRLRAGQEDILKGGDRKKFETARRDHDRAVRGLVARAGELLAQERGATSEQVISSVERTLRFASIDEEQRALLASGLFTAEVEAPGFGAFTGIDVPPAPAAAPPRTRKDEPSRRESGKDGRQETKRTEEQRQERQSRVAAAEDALKLAREREREARQEFRRAERAERKAAQDLKHATRDLTAARAALDTAEAAVEEASDRVKAVKRGI